VPNVDVRFVTPSCAIRYSRVKSEVCSSPTTSMTRVDASFEIWGCPQHAKYAMPAPMLLLIESTTLVTPIYCPLDVRTQRRNCLLSREHCSISLNIHFTLSR
jgi:hypothetical protein